MFGHSLGPGVHASRSGPRRGRNKRNLNLIYEREFNKPVVHQMKGGGMCFSPGGRMSGARRATATALPKPVRFLIVPILILILDLPLLTKIRVTDDTRFHVFTLRILGHVSRLTQISLQ